MSSYAVIAFATPVVAFLLGWVAVALHRRSLHARPPREELAERLAQQERELDALVEALEAKGEELRLKGIRLRAEADQIKRDEARRRTESDGGAVPAR